MHGESDPREVVIVGAGIAGLSAAWELRQRDIVVLESSDRVGGRIKSEARDGYWLNFGAHVFSGPDSVVGELIDALGVEAMAVPGRLIALALNGKIIAGGRVETYPFRLPMPLAARAGLIRAGARLRTAVARYHSLSERRSGESDEAVRGRVLAYRDSATFADFTGTLHPDAEAVFRATIQRSTADPDELSAGCGIGFFALVWSKGKGLSRNIIGGSSTLPEMLASRLPGRIEHRARVTELKSKGGLVHVRFTRGGAEEQITARCAIIATPAPIAREILPDLPPETAAALDAIPYGPYLVLSLLTGESDPMPWDDIYALATPKRSFNMMFNHANVLRPRSERRQPGGSLMLYSGGSLARRLLDRTDSEITDAYLTDLYEIYPQLKGQIRESVVQRWERALPYPAPGRSRLQPALERRLGEGNVFLAGDYLGTWYTETAAATGREAARRTLAALAERPKV